MEMHAITKFTNLHVYSNFPTLITDNNNGKQIMFLYVVARSYWIRSYIENILRVVGVNCGFDGLFF